MVNELTPIQERILRYIENHISQHQNSPTFREIAQHFGFQAVGTVQTHVQALLKKKALEKVPGLSRGFRVPKRDEDLGIPILGRIAAGLPLEHADNIDGHIAWTLPHKMNHRDVFALRVQGESMKDAGILNGDIVIAKKQHRAEHGDIVVALHQEGMTVKTLAKIKGRYYLKPANDKFVPMICDESTTIQGKVIGLSRLYS